MSGLLTPLLQSSDATALVVAAAPSEAGAILTARGLDASLRTSFWRRIALSERIGLVISGVGKANAAGATARALDLDRDAAVISLGVGGALPDSGLDLGQVVLASRSVMADEGLESAEGFRTSEALGFPARLGPGGAVGERMGVDADDRLAAALAPVASLRSIVATVSTCSGTDHRAMEVVARTGAAVEAMEGAAVGLAVWNAAASIGAPPPAFVELRIVSNTTGARERQRWDMAGALAALGRVSAAL